MNKRQILAGAAALIVLGTAFWYVALAPSRGSGVEPDASVRIALSATATGSGSWVRYLVTVKNLADGDFVGDVMLVDQERNGDQGAGGSTLPALARQPQLPTSPAVAGQSAYRVHVAVPSRTSRTIALLAPDFFNVVQALMGGTTLDEEPVDHAALLPVAVLSDVETPATAILGLRYDRFSPRVAQFDSARGFPTSALLLAGYATVVVDQFDTASLSETQVQALGDFVGLGGTLVLAGGAQWRRTIAPLPSDLLPIRPGSTASISLAPLARLAGATAGDLSVPAAVGAVAAGARRVLSADDGTPLVAELGYGTGRVIELAFDPSGQAEVGTPYSALGWDQALARSFQQTPAGVPMTSTLLGPDPAITALLPVAGDAPLPPLWLVGGVLLVYVLLAGPLGYLLVRRRWGRPALFWAVVPIVAVAFTALFYGTGSMLQGSLQDREIQVVKLGAGQTANVLEYHRILFLRRGDHVIDPRQNALVAPLTLETFRTTGSTCERCTSQLGGLPSGAEHALPAQRPTVEESGVVYGSVRVVSSSQTERAPGRLDSQIAVHAGHVQGTVVNTSQQPVWQLTLFSTDGQVVHEADLSAYVPPGGRVTVDGALGAAAGGPAASAESTLLRSVAATALSRDGQAVLVGLTAPLPTQLRVDGHRPPLGGLAVLQQVAALDRADSGVRDFQRKWLASSAGDVRSGFVDVYDIALPGSGVPLSVTYNPQWGSNMEVYDWDRGAFVPLAGTNGTDPTESRAPIGPSQLRDGIVRLRLHEPRISWGGNLWVDTGAPVSAGG